MIINWFIMKKDELIHLKATNVDFDEFFSILYLDPSRPIKVYTSQCKDLH